MTDVDAVERSLAQEGPGGVFTQSMLRGLPAPAQRYLRHAIAEGTPLAGSVELEMAGRFRTGASSPWMNMQGHELLNPPRGFVWHATMGRGMLRIHGHDLLAEGHGEMVFRLWNMLPVVHEEGPEVARSAAGRLGFESIWIPSALLPAFGAVWEPIDQARAAVTLQIYGRPVRMVVVVDGSGALVRVVGDRWNASSTPPRMETFGTSGLGMEQTFGGYTIPTKAIAGWNPGAEGSFDFFDVQILQAIYR